MLSDLDHTLFVTVLAWLAVMMVAWAAGSLFRWKEDCRTWAARRKTAWDSSRRINR
jgi:hypothetical protein